jgi:phage host-nuclease inhibitor protein Gam
MTEEPHHAPEDFEVPNDPIRRRLYAIRDDRHASWVMRKLRLIRRRQREMTALHESEARTLREELGIIEQWLADTNRPLDQEAAYLEGILGQYALRVRNEWEDHTKSVTLPWGRISTTASQATFVITDKDAVVAWAEAQGYDDVVKVEEKKTPLISVAKQYLDNAGGVAFDPQTGAVVNGVAVNPAKVTATVTLDQE